MSGQVMKFKGFIWPKNPAKLRVASEKDVKKYSMPYGGSLLKDHGIKRRVVTGEGAFTGEHAMDTFEKLRALLGEGGSGLLTLPDSTPMAAFFISLDLVGETVPNVVRYTFLFWEDDTVPVGDAGTLRNRIYTSKEGENLWEIATRYHTSLEKLLACNPQIQWPNFLEEGEIVMLP